MFFLYDSNERTSVHHQVPRRRRIGKGALARTDQGEGKDGERPGQGADPSRGEPLFLSSCPNGGSIRRRASLEKRRKRTRRSGDSRRAIPLASTRTCSSSSSSSTSSGKTAGPGEKLKTRSVMACTGKSWGFPGQNRSHCREGQRATFPGGAGSGLAIIAGAGAGSAAVRYAAACDA